MDMTVSKPVSHQLPNNLLRPTTRSLQMPIVGNPGVSTGVDFTNLSTKSPEDGLVAQPFPGVGQPTVLPIFIIPKDPSSVELTGDNGVPSGVPANVDLTQAKQVEDVTKGLQKPVDEAGIQAPAKGAEPAEPDFPKDLAPIGLSGQDIIIDGKIVTNPSELELKSEPDSLGNEKLEFSISLPEGMQLSDEEMATLQAKIKLDLSGELAGKLTTGKEAVATDVMPAHPDDKAGVVATPVTEAELIAKGIDPANVGEGTKTAGESRLDEYLRLKNRTPEEVKADRAAEMQRNVETLSNAGIQLSDLVNLSPADLEKLSLIIAEMRDRNIDHENALPPLSAPPVATENAPTLT